MTKGHRLIEASALCVAVLAVAASGCRGRSVGIRDDGGPGNDNADAFVEPLCGNGVMTNLMVGRRSPFHSSIAALRVAA